MNRWLPYLRTHLQDIEISRWRCEPQIPGSRVWGLFWLRKWGFGVAIWSWVLGVRMRICVQHFALGFGVGARFRVEGLGFRGGT